MSRNTICNKMLCAAFSVLLTSTAMGQQPTTYLLKPELNAGDSAEVTVSLEVGGDMLVRDETDIKKIPLSVSAESQYQEHLIAWSADSKSVARSIRHYEKSTATIQKEPNQAARSLPPEQHIVVAEIRDGLLSFQGNKHPLSRDEFDLINVVGNTLALDRLLPGRAASEGETWQHDEATLGALLGMDHVAVCEVSSVVTGESHRQVQLRLAGTVHGTIDAAPVEIALRGAYLFHLGRKRITKFNLAIQEKRSPSDVVPGLDVVAKVSLVLQPTTESLCTDAQVKQASDLAKPLGQTMRFEAREQRYRFLHDATWFITAEQSEFVSLSCQALDDQIAHCNIATLPARSSGRETTLEQFERDVRASLKENLDSIAAATQWTTKQGHDCLGIVARGKVSEMPVEWRYYLVASPDMPRVALTVTIEQSMLEKFADADRQLIDTLELLPKRKELNTAQRKPVASR